MNRSKTSQENDVSALIFAPVKISVLEDALKEVFPEAKVSKYTSGFSGAETLHLRGDVADFEGYPDSTDGTGSDSDYLLNGMIEGDVEVAVAKAKKLFARIIEAGMKVQYEVYDPAGDTIIEQKSTGR